MTSKAMPQNDSLAVTNEFGTLPVWNLADLYAGMDSPKLKDDMADAMREAKAFSDAYAGKLANIAAKPGAAQKLFDILKRYEALDDLMGRIGSYAGLIYATDTTNPAHAKFYGDTQGHLTDAAGHTLFFALEFNRLDEKLVSSLTAQKPLNHYKPWVDDTRIELPHQLDDKLEKLFLEKSTTSYSAWNRLFDETISDLRFKVGDESLAIEPTLNMMVDKDETKRKLAADAIGVTLKANLRTFTLITNTLAKDKSISDSWRNFEDVADARHLSNRVEREVVDALVSAVHAAYPRLTHRYYKLKAKWFGKETLNHWDRNAPLPDANTKIYSFTEAKDIVLGAYAGFSPKMATIAEKFFHGYIDAPVRPGKAPGAFAHPTVPSAHPYVLLNYMGKPRDVMTMAHELGHGVHQVLAGHTGALMAPTPLTLAETASVFGEMLTFRAMLDAAGPAQRKMMLASKVEDMLNTVVRQIAFYTFERKVHEARKNGELTAEQICELWMSVQAESLGPSIKFGEGYETYWAYIPHFIHSPFYVYAYAFGDCLVNSLYGVYEKSHAGFAERYFALLSAGGTKHHSELLKPFGLDAKDPAFWQIGLNMIEGMIVELEGM